MKAECWALWYRQIWRIPAYGESWLIAVIAGVIVTLTT